MDKSEKKPEQHNQSLERNMIEQRQRLEAQRAAELRRVADRGVASEDNLTEIGRNKESRENGEKKYSSSDQMVNVPEESSQRFSSDNKSYSDRLDHLASTRNLSENDRQKLLHRMENTLDRTDPYWREGDSRTSRSVSEKRTIDKYAWSREQEEVSQSTAKESHLMREEGKDINDVRLDRDKQSRVVEEMAKKDFPVAPEKGSDNTNDFHYVDEAEFGAELKGRSPDRDAELTDGFYDGRDGQAFVKDSEDTLVTGIHEKLHQKSKSELPVGLNDGITEHFARQEAGAIGDLKKIDSHGREIQKGQYYEREVEIVRKLEATVGREPLEKAYFEGDSDILKNHVEGVLGDGAFEKLCDALEKKDYETASRIIRNK